MMCWRCCWWEIRAWTSCSSPVHRQIALVSVSVGVLIGLRSAGGIGPGLGPFMKLSSAGVTWRKATGAVTAPVRSNDEIGALAGALTR